MTLGEFIQQYRKEHDMSVRAFARLCDISPTYITILEKGQNSNGSVPSPSIETYILIAKAVGVQLDDLIHMVQDNVVVNPTSSVEEQSMMSLYRKASDLDKDIIRKLLSKYEVSEELETEDTASTLVS